MIQKYGATPDRGSFTGGSDARTIMGNDEAALLRLWQEKRGEIGPVDLSANLVVQLGVATDDLNRRWYEVQTGQVITDLQKRIRDPTVRWTGATMDGRLRGSDAMFEAKFIAALVLIGRGGRRKIYVTAAARYVGGGSTHRGAFGHCRRRQMGRDQGGCRPTIPAPACHRRAEILARCREWRAPASVRDRST